jgi:hypothetical protein
VKRYGEGKLQPRQQKGEVVHRRLLPLLPRFNASRIVEIIE